VPLSMNSVMRRFGLELRKARVSEHQGRAELKAKGNARGTVLLAYILKPFLLRDNDSVPKSHTHYMESLTIAEAFLDLGYDVDVIDYRNATFKPQKNYSFFVSARTNFTKIAPRLNNDCIKIAHLDTAHFLFNNATAFERLLEMQKRRGKTAYSMKLIEKNWAPEHADYLAVLGNEFTLSTYRYSGKKMFDLPVPTPSVYPSPADKNVDSARKRFIWLGSNGLVHKGLDLTLEAFSQLPDHHLIVCGPVDDASEQEFKNIYSRELYETSNIETIGWIDVTSEKFIELAASCIGLVYPSCSEGQAGAVVTCMQAGLIPIVSYESGIDVDDFGLVLENCSVPKIIEAVTSVSTEPLPNLRERATKSWQQARQNHTQEHYLAKYQKMIETILAEQSN
jgi:glycosyltransferase involved in cell wall biosynthesis